jgi:hypothetical protein
MPSQRLSPRLAERGSHWPRSSSWLGLQSEPWIAQCRRAKPNAGALNRDGRSFLPGESDRDLTSSAPFRPLLEPSRPLLVIPVRGLAFQSTRCQIRHWIARIDKQPKLRIRRHKLPQQLQLFGHQHVGQKAHTRPPMRGGNGLAARLARSEANVTGFISHHSGGSPL